MEAAHDPSSAIYTDVLGDKEWLQALLATTLNTAVVLADYFVFLSRIELRLLLLKDSQIISGKEIWSADN